MATSATPIGRVPVDPALTAPSESVTATGSDSTSLPTLNPADSPCQPLNLPQQDPKGQAPIPQEEPVQNLGAVSHAGAIAYMADKILRGAMQGYEAAQQ